MLGPQKWSETESPKQLHWSTHIPSQFIDSSENDEASVAFWNETQINFIRLYLMIHLQTVRSPIYVMFQITEKKTLNSSVHDTEAAQWINLITMDTYTVIFY